MADLWDDFEAGTAAKPQASDDLWGDFDRVPVDFSGVQATVDSTARPAIPNVSVGAPTPVALGDVVEPEGIAGGDLLGGILGAITNPAAALGQITAPIARGIADTEFADTFQRGAASAVAGVTHTLGDLIDQTVQQSNPVPLWLDAAGVAVPEAVSDPLGARAMAADALGANREIAAEREAAMAAIGDMPGLGDYLTDPTAALQIQGQRLGTMATESAPLFAAALATRSPAAGSALMGGVTGGQTYTDLRGDGIGRLDAAEAGALSALAEAAGEGVSLPRVMGGGGVAQAALAEGLQELGVSLAQTNITDQATGNETPVLQQITDALEAAGVGGLVGGGANAAINAPRLLQREQAAPPAPAPAPLGDPEPAPQPAPQAQDDAIAPEDDADIAELLVRNLLDPAVAAELGIEPESTPAPVLDVQRIAAALGDPEPADPDARFRRPAPESAPAAPPALEASEVRTSQPAQILYRGTREGESGSGVFYTTDRAYAEQYGDQIETLEGFNAKPVDLTGALDPALDDTFDAGRLEGALESAIGADATDRVMRAMPPGGTETHIAVRQVMSEPAVAALREAGVQALKFKQGTGDTVAVLNKPSAGPAARTPEPSGQASAPQSAPAGAGADLGKLYQRGNGKNNSSAQALQLPDGTWRVRSRKAGRWQEWEVRDSFDPSPAFGYRETAMGGGAVNVPGVGRVPVTKADAESKREADYNPLLDMIAGAGGISREDAARMGVDPAELNARRGIKPLYGKAGIPLDSLREMMIEEGYFPDEDPNAPPSIDLNDVWEMASRALSGEPVGPLNDERMLDLQMQAQADRYGPEETPADRDPDEDLAAWFDEVEDEAGEAVSIGDEAELLSIAELAQRAAEAGVDDMDLTRFTGEPDGAYAARLWQEIYRAEANRGADRKAEASGVRDRVQAGEGRQAGFSLQADPAPRAQEVAPAPSAGLFGAPSARDFIDDAQRSRDARRDGKTGTGRTDMLAGDGELFAGDRPAQASVPESPFTAADLERIRAKPARERTDAEIDAANAFTREQARAGQEADAAKEDAKQAERDDTDGFADAMPPMQRKRVIDALNTQVSMNGKADTRKAHMRRAVAEGATVGESGEGRALLRPGGAYVLESKVSKTALDYAEHLTQRQPTSEALESVEDQTDSPAFKRWFGESVVTDSAGRPLVVYHGAPDARFMGADATFMSMRDRYGEQRGVGAFWFARDYTTARSYADDTRAFDYQNAESAVIPAFLKLENPLIVDGGGKEWREAQAIGKTTDVIAKAQAEGHDGVIVRNVRDNYNNGPRTKPTDTYVVFDSRQIKSADRNAGSFDPENPSILASEEAAELSETDLTPSERAAFNRSPAQQAEQSREDGSDDADLLGLREAVDAVLGNAGVTVEYLRGYAGLPDNLRRSVESRNSTGRRGRTAGLYDPASQRVFLFTDVVDTPERAAFTAAHEIAGHHGLRTLLGDKLNPALRIAMQNPTVAKVADAIAKERKLGGDERLLATEEALAELAAAVRTGDYAHIESRYNVPVPEGIRAKVARAVENFLRRLKVLFNGLVGLEPFTDEDVRGLLEAAWQAVDGDAATTVGADSLASMEPDDYRGEHEAPDSSSGSPLWNVALNGSYPDDVYSANGLRYYGTGEASWDSEAYNLIRRMREKPNGFVEVYRAVPKSIKGNKIQRGSWVTPVRSYAEDHGEGALNGDYRIQKMTVRPRDLWTNGDSWVEWGYDPQPHDPASEVAKREGRPYVPERDSILESVEAGNRAEQRRNEAADALEINRGAAGWNYDSGAWEGRKGELSRARASLQDKMLSWRDVQNQIASQVGQAIPDAQNVYRLENLMHGRVKEGLDRIEEAQIVPLMEAMKAAGVNPAALEEYLYARHAKERNAKIAEINPAMPDGGSGMTNAEADAILAGADKAKLDPLAKRVDAMTRATRRRLLQHGLITQEQHDAMEAQYSAYVPLKGKETAETDFEANSAGPGRGLDTRAQPVKQALGRGAGNRATDIIANVIADSQRSVILAEKARVGRAVMRLVLANPNPALWQVEPVQTERAVDAAGEVYERVVNDWSDPSIVAVRHRGQIYKVQINNKAMAMALNNVGVDQLGVITRYAGAINRYFSAVLTKYNPAFIPVNASRDALFGLVGLASEHGEAAALDAALHYPLAARAAFRQAIRKSGDGQWDTWAKEFANAGGKTGYVAMPSAEDLARKIGKGGLSSYSPDGLAKAARALGDAVGSINDAVENALRLSAYVTLRKRGMSTDAAAEYAKNLTVNFNRKGMDGSKFNAWFLFYNAAMQGAHRVSKLLRNPKAWAYTGGLVGVQVMAAMAAMGMEDDDGEPLWNKIPDHVKRRNIVIVTPDGGVVTIPMPYGLNVFTYAAGRLVGALLDEEQGKPTNRAGAITGDLLSATVESFSPVPIGEGGLGLLPTVLRIPVNVQTNRNDFGHAIRKESPYSKFDIPRASMGRPDTLEVFKLIATGMNRIGGGDEYTPPSLSWFDVAPEDVEYLLGELTGGAGRFITDAATWAQKATGDLPMKPQDRPIIKRFVTSIDEQAAQNALFYDRRDTIARSLDRLRDTFQNDGAEAAEKMLAAMPELKGAGFRRRKNASERGPVGSIITSDGRPQIVVKDDDAVFGKYKAAEKAVEFRNESVRDAYTRTPGSLLPSKESRMRDNITENLNTQRQYAQHEFNKAWTRDVVGSAE